MTEEELGSIMSESGDVSGVQRRRSPRLCSPPLADVSSGNKMALAWVPKRSIAVRKIVPRKTAAHPEQDKENTPGPLEPKDVQEKKQKVSTPSLPAAPARRASTSTGKKQQQKASLPSPILPSSPPPSSQLPDPVWSQKVRRSYSRLSDGSPSTGRETLFGFEQLKTPEVNHRGTAAAQASCSLTGLNSFTSLLEAEDLPAVDVNIPGVAVVKERRRRKKVQQIDSVELDVLAARMNAEFEEAEEFELFVE